jgi:NitT/TauT family transport system permease protein
MTSRSLRPDRAIPVRQSRAGYLIVYGSQILKLNIVMTAITLLAIVSSLMYLAISWREAAVMRRR